MRDLIIGACTNYDWNKLKFWVNSINQSGFTGDKIMIAFNIDYATIEKLKEAGFEIILPGKNNESKQSFEYQSSLPIHVERFVHIYNYLRSHDEYRYVITTDVKDVVFQKNVSEALDIELGARQQFIFASESMKYKDEPWGNQNLIETFGPFFHEIFKENEIFNVGVLAGRGNSMRDLAAMIFVMSVNRPIPIVDQSTFNFMVSQEPYKSVARYAKSEEGWACQLGTTADPSKINQFKPYLLEASPIMENGKITTSTGKIFTIAHQYDRVPEWRKIIEEKYND
jgi:hypothetical protein